MFISKLETLLLMFINKTPDYGFVGNAPVDVSDYLGLFYVDATHCMERCDALGLGQGFIKKCYDKCLDDPCYIPTVDDFLTPPDIKPGWDFEHPRKNWETILDAIRKWIEWLRKNRNKK